MFINEIKNVLRKKEVCGLILSIPKTLWFNFRYLPFRHAVRLPIWIHYACKYDINMGGIILVENPHIAMIRIGFSIDYAVNFSDMTYLRVEEGAKLIFGGSAHLGRGSKIAVHNNATLELGECFAISASSAIKCYKHIKMGKEVLFAWDCLVMDSDGHAVLDNEGNRINDDYEIIIGDKVWIGCRTTILKGVIIPNNCVIGASTTIVKGDYKANTVIVGNPPLSKRIISKWSK